MIYYTVIISPNAESDLKALKKSEPQAYRKAVSLIKELVEHPRTGRGKPSLKRHGLAGFYARKITDKHRLVYAIDDGIMTIDVVSAKGHYDDK